MSSLAPAAIINTNIAAQDRQSRSGWRAHLYILPAFVISLAVCVWFAIWGDWRLFQPEALGAFYDAQALSILNGRLDVPPEAISFEAFIVGGKYYGYFGVGPALLRIPLLLLFQNLDGLWSRTMVISASAIGLVCAYQILLLVRGDVAQTRTQRLLDSIFITAAAIGSTNIFIVARPFLFHEAIIWGTTFSLLFACALLKYLQSPSSRSLIFACFFAFMSFHSRATAGAGALLALCVLAAILLYRAVTKKEITRELLGFAAVRQMRRHVLIVVAGIGFTLVTFIGVNYAKFGTFSALPLQYYNLYVQQPERMRVTGAKQIHLENLPTGLATYFGFTGARFDRHFPWIYLANAPSIIGKPAIDVVEGFSSFPVSMPALTLLAAIGAVVLVGGRDENIRRFRLPAGALFLGGSIILVTVGITERYLHDLYPALIFCAAVGVRTISLGKYIPLKVTAVALLAAVSIACNSAFALVNQSVAAWGVPPQRRAEFGRLQERVDALF